MKHDRFVAVANRQCTYRLRDALFAAFGASLLAFQVAAFSFALTATPSGVLAAQSSQQNSIDQMTCEPDLEIRPIRC